MRNRPLVLPLACLVAGAASASFGYVPHPWFWYLILPCLLLVGRYLSWRPLLLVGVACGCAYLANYQIHARLNPPAPIKLLLQTGDQPVTLTGIVEPRPESGVDRSRLVVRIADAGNPRQAWRLLVVVGSGTPEVTTGDRVRFTGRLKEPRTLELPGAFDRQRYLAWQGIYATTYLSSASDIEVVAASAAYPVRRRFDQLARELARQIDRSTSPPASGVLKALLLGLREDVPPDLSKLYAVTGVNHILSVSGFHVGVVAISLLALIKWGARWSGSLLLWLNVRRWAVLAVLPAIYGYLLLTGSAPATVRSVLMLALVCLALIDEREHDYLDVLILAAVVLLVSAPWLLFDISCQLSFLALWGILALTPRLLPSLTLSVPSPWRRLPGVLAASLAAILATAPLVAYYFHFFSFTGVAANLIVIPCIGYGAVVIGCAGLSLAFLLPSIAGLLFTLAGWLVTIANRGVEMLAAAPVWRGISPSQSELLLWLGGVLAFGMLPKRWAMPAATALIVGGLTCHVLTANEGDGRLQLTFLSLGQAEATLLRFPDGTTMLIDTGGPQARDDSAWGERVLAPALWRLGVRSLDYLVLTHPHDDHAGGAPYLLAAFPVGELWCGGEGAEWSALASAAFRQRIPLRVVDGRTPPLRVGQAECRFFWPLPEGAAGDANDRSLVMRLAVSGVSLLFTGDIGWEVADHLAGRHGSALASTVLKVPHHGSRHSSAPAFYRAVSPQLALVSAGFRNRFGLPAVETLAELHARGIQLVRTDLDGTTRIIAAGHESPIAVRRHFWQWH